MRWFAVLLAFPLLVAPLLGPSPAFAAPSRHQYGCARMVPAQRGETLRELVQRVYGHAVELRRIMRENPWVTDPDAVIPRGRYVCLPHHTQTF